MSESSKLLDFYSEPSVIEFTRNSDELVRQAVTKISASYSFLNDIIDESEKKEAEFYLNSITSGCFRILGSVLINSLLAKAADERNCKPVLIWAEVYLKEIVQQCQRILVEDCMVSYNGHAYHNIRADKDMFTYFIIGLVMRLICTIGKKSFNIDFSAETDGKYIYLTISEACENIQENNNIIPHNDRFYSADDEAYSIFAQKLNAEYSFSANSLHISFKYAESNRELNFEASKTDLRDRLFSPCSIMLNDFADYLDFY